MDPRGLVAVILALSVCLFLIGGAVGHALGAPPFSEGALGASKEILLALTGGLLAWLSFGKVDK